VIIRFANAPSEPLPTHSATPPVFASPRSSTTRHGAAAPLTYTSTFDLATTMRARNHPSGSGGGSTACSNWPGRSVRSFCHVLAGGEKYCTEWARCSAPTARKLKELRPFPWCQSAEIGPD
jgi:hypothetical protein